MKNRKCCGQESVEFILVTILVFFGTLFTILLFGGKIAAFFETDSSAAKIVNNTPDVVDPNSIGKYNPDYDTKALIDNNANLAAQQTEVTVDVSGLNDVIATSGASGAVDLLSGNVGALSQYMDQLKTAYPDDPDIDQMISLLHQMEDAGHLVADCQEWYEAAARRLTSSGTVYVPDNNNVCQNGGLVGQSGCDKDVVKQDFLFTKSELSNNLDKYNNAFLALNEQFQQLAADKGDDVKAITSKVDALCQDIDQISDNVKLVVSQNKVEDFDSLKAGVASQTTDYKSEEIGDTAGEVPVDTTEQPANESTI